MVPRFECKPDLHVSLECSQTNVIVLIYIKPNKNYSIINFVSVRTGGYGGHKHHWVNEVINISRPFPRCVRFSKELRVNYSCSSLKKI